MTKHIKHQDSLNVQAQTKILDQYGNPIEGAIEYDPNTGYGKRIKDAKLGLVEDFFCKDGSIELDGHNFDDTNQDENQVNAIRTLIDARVARGTPEYEELLKHHIDTNRANEKQKQKDKAKSQAAPGAEPSFIATAPMPTKFIATTQIARGEEAIIDFETGHITGTRADNIAKSKREVGRDKKTFE